MGLAGAPFLEIPKRNAGKPEGFTGETVSGALDRSFDGKGRTYLTDCMGDFSESRREQPKEGGDLKRVVAPDPVPVGRTGADGILPPGI